MGVLTATDRNSIQFYRRLKATLGCIALFFLVWFLFKDILNLWWTRDDTQILKFASTYSPYQYFTQPSVWWEYTNRFLTPLQILSFEVDKLLFSFTPKWYYAHQLFALSLCSFIMFLFLNRYLPVWLSLTGATLFLIGSPTVVVVQQLMDRHYIEGLLFSFASIFCFIKAVESRQLRWSYASTVAYALSMAYKEVYVPLVLILLAWPEASWRKRLKYSIPHMGALLFYMVWRWWMLGTLFGGYERRINAMSVLLLPYNVLKFCFGLTSPLSICLTVFIAISVLTVWFGKWRQISFLTVAALVIILPIIPVSSDITYTSRYSFVAWAGLCFFFVFAAYLYWRNGIAGKVLCGLLVLASFFAVGSRSLEVWNSNLAYAKQMSAEGLFVMRNAHNESNILRHPSSPGWYFRGVMWLAHLKEARLNQIWFYDDIYLCENNLNDKRIYEYDKKSQDILDVTKIAYSIKNNYCRRIRINAPFEVSVRYTGSAVSWRLGPYADGHYFYIAQNGSDGFEIPPTGHLRIHLVKGTSFRIRYDSPEGWSTYSPELFVRKTAAGSLVDWKRSAVDSAKTTFR